MLCHCYRLTAAHEHSPRACTSQVPVPPRHTPTTAEPSSVPESLSDMSIRIMQEQVAEEAMWADRLRPQIERELRIRIAEEIERDPTRGIEALRNLYVTGLANSAEKHVLRTLDAIRVHVEHWLCGIRDGSVGRWTKTKTSEDPRGPVPSGWWAGARWCTRSSTCRYADDHGGPCSDERKDSE